MYTEGVNTFVYVRYDQERNAIACLFQNQPLTTLKECVIYTGHQPKRGFGNDTDFVVVNIPLNTPEELLVEARSEGHTPVFVILDAEDPKAASLSKLASSSACISSSNGFIL